MLAKHDETYMPKDVADALKRSGHWNPAKGCAAAGEQLEQHYHRVGHGACGDKLIPELGHFALALGVVLAFAQAVHRHLWRTPARRAADGRRTG